MSTKQTVQTKKIPWSILQTGVHEHPADADKRTQEYLDQQAATDSTTDD